MQTIHGIFGNLEIHTNLVGAAVTTVGAILCRPGGRRESAHMYLAYRIPDLPDLDVVATRVSTHEACVRVKRIACVTAEILVAG